jgi:methyl-accepting chemotaxis protein-1 (serine sensor receptor)
MKIKNPVAIFSKLRLVSIKARLTLVLSFLGILLAAGAVVCLGMMSWQNEGMRRSYTQAMIPVQIMGELRAKSLRNFSDLKEAAGSIGKSYLVKQKVGDSKKIRKKIAALNKKLEAIPMSDAIAKKYQSYRDTDKNYWANLDRIYDALLQDSKSSDYLLETLVHPLLRGRMTALNKLIQGQSDEMEQIYQAQVRRYHRVRMVVLIGLVVGLLVAALMSVLLVRSLSSTLKQLADVAYAIAEGHLGHDIKVKRRDELGKLLVAFRVMDERLATIVGKVRQGSEAVSSAAQQIAHGSEGLGQRTQEQASSLEEAASSMEEMSSTVKQNADNANHANDLAGSTREQAEHGGEVVKEAVAAMDEIDAASSKIGDIVRLIQDIAFQTNLLALNAAVEAARAGEQGRGFAVVASEVRSLAQRSADAATEIKQLIADSEEKVRAGSTLVNQSGEALSGIVGSVKKVANIMSEIATANQEQSVGIDQVSNAVMQIEEMTQQNSALVEEASTAAQSMQKQATELAHQVSFFQLDDHAPETEGAQAAPAMDTNPATEEASTDTGKIRQPATLAFEAASTDTWEAF